MHILMTALGSYGDVFPIVGLGATMLDRGHKVTILTNPHFQSVVESAGLQLFPIGTTEEYDELAHNEDLWNPVRGPQMIMRTCIEMTLLPIYEYLESNYQPGETILVAHILDMASRVFQEKHNAPMASVHLAPVGLRSFHNSSPMFGMMMQNWLPRWFRKSQYWAADKLIDHLVGPEINRLRQEQGLSPVRGIMRDWYFSPQLVLGLFPDWFAAAQPDWPPNTRLTGFPLWDGAESAPMPTDAAEFLAAGEPPIIFSPGSANTEGQGFFSAAVEACQKLGRRGMLLTKYPNQIPKQLPDGVQHFSFVPFSQLLPKAAAMVHHGGIGNTAQALAAGLPQVVMPMAYDQLDNATRLKQLGVADFIRRKKFNGPRLTKTLQHLLTSKTTQTACRDCKEKLATNTARTQTCELIENLAE